MTREEALEKLIDAATDLKKAATHVDVCKCAERMILASIDHAKACGMRLPCCECFGLGSHHHKVRDDGSIASDREGHPCLRCQGTGEEPKP